MKKFRVIAWIHVEARNEDEAENLVALQLEKNEKTCCIECMQTEEGV